MADILDSDINSTDEVTIEEVQEDCKPIFTFSEERWFFTGKSKQDSSNSTYLNDWCNTDKNENINEFVNINKNDDEEEEEKNLEDKGGGGDEPPVEIKIEDTSEGEEESDDQDPNVNSCFNIQPVPTLEELANSDYLHNRQLAARKILEFLQQAGSNQKELQSVISVMCKLSEDEEGMVQYELMQSIPAIASYCQSEPHLRIVIRQQLMPYTVKLLNDVHLLIRKSGQSALLILLEKNLIDQSQLVEWICPLVAQLVMCETNLEELRIEDVSLMSKMIPLVGCETTLKFFLDPFVSLCCDPAFGIRKMCALGFGTLCKIVGSEVTEFSLLPAFLNLCNDEMWQARKACADVFIDVANSVSTKTRKEILSHIFVNLLTDNHWSVKYSAYQSLGTFIYTFANPKQTGCSYENGEIIIDEAHNNAARCDPNSSTFDRCKNNNRSEFLVKNHPERSWHGSNRSDSITFFNSNPVLHSHPESDATLAAKYTSIATEPVCFNDTENNFNNFQFWRVPLPEVEFDIDLEMTKVTNKVSANVRESNPSIADITSDRSSSSNTLSRCSKVLSSKEQRLLDDDTEVLWSSFKESILTFKHNESDIHLEDSNTSLTSTKVENNSLDTEIIKDISSLTPYDQDIVPPILLFSFISFVDNYPYEMNKAYEDDELGYIAYSFPAVAFTLGRRYWPCIKKTCEKLARNMKWTVRRTIASSLHELATILGYDIVMSDLLPIFLDLFKDVDEVRLRLVQHLSDFLKHLRPEDRKQFLPLIEDFTKMDNDKNWRFRCAVAEQLIKTVELYDTNEIPEYFMSPASSLLHDRVSAVRLAAVELMAVLLKRMHEDPRTDNCFETMLSGIDDLYRQAPKWVYRQTYIKLCEQLILKESMPMFEFVEKVAPKLFSLAWDEVPNVRLTLIRCMSTALLPKQFVTTIVSTPCHELLIKVQNSLKLDVDRDVRYFAEQFSSSYLQIICKQLKQEIDETV